MPGRAKSLFQRVLILAATRPVFTAEWWVIGGTGNVRSVVDWNGYALDAHVLDQSDTAKQYAPPTIRAEYNNQLAFLATGVEEYSSSRAAAYWAIAHQDNFFCAGVASPNTTTAGHSPLRLTTKAWAGVVVGWHLDLFNEAGPVCRLYANTANGTAVVAGSNAAALATVDNPLVADVVRVTSWYGDATGYTARSKGAVVSSAAYLAARAAGAPVSTFTLQNGANQRGRWAMIYMAPAPNAPFTQYCLQKYGQAA